MNEVWRQQYLDLWFGRPCADEQLCQEYDRWQQRLKACYWHIQRFFKLTGNLPVVGDLLRILEGEQDWRCPALYIESRTLFTCVGDNSMQVIYEVQSTHMEALESQLGKETVEVAQV